MINNNYIGRFAPSPTGLLHIGSLLTALASYFDAKSNKGKWLIRIEDLDPLREQSGASANILFTLESFGLKWDKTVIYQSQRYSIYQDILEELKQKKLVYPCFCSRKTWQTSSNHLGLDGFIYNGYCSKILINNRNLSNKNPAWRIRVPKQNIGFIDKIIGFYQQNLAQDIGDFIVLRADGYWAYQLAVVVDDAKQNITHIVRGQDLLVSTPRQIYLQKCLNYSEPIYAHLPLLTNKLGQKWSKQTFAPALDLNKKEQILRQIMSFLNIPSAPEVDKIEHLLEWGIQNWNIDNISKKSICTE